MESKGVSKRHWGPRAPWRQEEFLPSTLWSDLLVSDLTKYYRYLGGRTVELGHLACALQHSMLYVGPLNTHEGPSARIREAPWHMVANMEARLHPIVNNIER